MRLAKADFYRAGGLSNPDLYRKADKRGRWCHYRRTR